MKALKIMLVLVVVVGIFAAGDCYGGVQRGDGLHIPGNAAAMNYAVQRPDGLRIPQVEYARLDGLHIPE